MDPVLLLIQVAILIISVIIHEVSHGFVALQLGDPTAKNAGRLSLNPLKHLDLWGSFLIPLFLLVARSPILLGWAKPVPYNPYNLKNQKWGDAMVALGGPGSNLLLALVFGLPLRFVPWGNSIYAYNLVQVFSLIVLINLLLAIFNLIPIPPLDGSKILFTFLSYRHENIRATLERSGFFILILFIFFFSQYLMPIVFWVFKIITGVSI